MSMGMRLNTLGDYAFAPPVDAPDELIQDGWSRLEREIREVSRSMGYEYRNSIVEMIALLGTHRSIDSDIIEELHGLRRIRNALVHDLDAPTMNRDDIGKYARRLMALTWYLSELR